MCYRCLLSLKDVESRLQVMQTKPLSREVGDIRVASSRGCWLKGKVEPTLSGGLVGRTGGGRKVEGGRERLGSEGHGLDAAVQVSIVHVA